MTADYSLTLYLNLNLSVEEIVSISVKKVNLNVLAFKPCGHGIGYIVIRASVLGETFYLCCRLLIEKSVISSELSCYFFQGSLISSELSCYFFQGYRTFLD